MASAVRTVRSGNRIEPFQHERRQTTVLKYIFLLVAQCGLLVLIGVWMNRTYNSRKDLHCGLWRISVYLALAAVFGLLFAIALRWASLRKLKKVFSQDKLDFSSFSRTLDDSSLVVNPMTYNEGLSEAVDAIRDAIDSVKKEEKELYTATRFLLSPDGQKLLCDIRKGISNFGLVRGKLVRKDTFKFWIFSAASSLCFFISLGGAFISVQSCRSLPVFLQFLEYFSVTLLTVMAIATFSGVSEGVKLVYVSSQKFEITRDEKFLISLLAANSNGSFSGFSRNPCSGYANIGKEGFAEAFVPMHMSLFAYREARTDGDGPMREYDHSADDCVGNYEMCGVAPIQILSA